MNIEPWFIPFDILLIICASFTIFLAITFISIIIFDKTCRTIPMVLIANTCLGVLMFATTRISMNAFTLQNDLHQVAHHYTSCYFLAYTEYASFCVQNYSFFQQAFYRYMTVVYPTRFFWQSAKFQLSLVGIIWMFSFVFCIPYIATGEIQYHAADQICQMPLRLSWLMLYNTLLVYTIPLSAMIFLYIKLVRYVRRMSQRVTTANTLLRAQRELKIVRRTVLLVIGVVIIGIPYLIFILMSFFTSPPKYHFRIAYIFVDVSLAFLMVTLFAFTEPLKAFVRRRLNEQMNTIFATAT